MAHDDDRRDQSDDVVPVDPPVPAAPPTAKELAQTAHEGTLAAALEAKKAARKAADIAAKPLVPVIDPPTTVAEELPAALADSAKKSEAAVTVAAQATDRVEDAELDENDEKRDQDDKERDDIV